MIKGLKGQLAQSAAVKFLVYSKRDADSRVDSGHESVNITLGVSICSHMSRQTDFVTFCERKTSKIVKDYIYCLAAGTTTKF